MRRIFVANLIGLVAICSGTAGLAFNEDSESFGDQVGTCSVSGQVIDASTTAYVNLFDSNFTQYAPEGSAFIAGGGIGAFPAITQHSPSGMPTDVKIA